MPPHLRRCALRLPSRGSACGPSTPRWAWRPCESAEPATPDRPPHRTAGSSPCTQGDLDAAGRARPRRCLPFQLERVLSGGATRPLRAAVGGGLPGLCGRSSRQGPLRRPSPRLRLRAAPAPALPPLTAHPRRPQPALMAAKALRGPCGARTSKESAYAEHRVNPPLSSSLSLSVERPQAGQGVSI